MPAPNPDAIAVHSPTVEVGNSATTAHSGDRMAPGSGLIIGLLMVSAFVVLLNEMMLGVALPTLIVYVVAGRYFVRGLMAGAVKG